MIDDTVRVEVEGPAMAASIRAGVDAPPTEHASEETPELRGAKRRIALAEAGVDRVQSAIDRLGASSIIADDPSDDPPAAWDAIVRARRSVVALRAERELALRASLSAANRELEEANRALEAAADRDRRAGSARPAKQHELRKLVDIELVANGPAAPVTIHLEYLVAAARWAPSYVARLEGERVSVEVRAVVAQDTGEDWTAVPLRLSTAEPTRFAQLPELAAQRIGRRQQEPARAGFRAPPIGAEALYADYDRDVAPLRRRADEAKRGMVTRTTTIAAPKQPKTVTLGAPSDEPAPYAEAPDATVELEEQSFGARANLRQEVWDEESSAAKAAFSTPPAGSVMPSAPPQQAAEARKGIASGRVMRMKTEPLGGDTGGAVKHEAAPPPPPPEPSMMLDYANLVMAPPSSGSRGRLVAPPQGAHHTIAASVVNGRARIYGLDLPRGCSADWSHTYDYAFATDGAVDVRADGAWHSIAVTAKSSAVKIHHVAVPREQADVFRVAAIPNPFAGPLLPAPIDVYDRGKFLVTSSVDFTPPGATVDVGLGVDAAVKIARNSEFREEATGMLRGVLRLHHSIAIELENVSGRSIDLEVRERIPVKRDGDDDVEVTPTKIEPAWESWTPDADAPRDRKLRGGFRWRLVVPAGQKRTLRAGYEVKISGKFELVGGNRRES